MVNFHTYSTLNILYRTTANLEDYVDRRRRIQETQSSSSHHFHSLTALEILFN
jgi:hypothetical protein